MTPAAMRVLRLAHEVVEGGGASLPCSLGVYCLRCCLARAKILYDEEMKITIPFSSWGSEICDTDLPLLHSRQAINKYDSGIAHTRDSALALIEKVMIECSTSVE